MKWRFQTSPWVVVVSAFVVFVLGYSVYSKVTMPTPEESLNLAIGAYNYTSTTLDEELKELFAEEGIVQVTLGHCDAADTEQLSQYLATYGLYDADLFLVDQVVITMLDGCCTRLSDEMKAFLEEGLPFQLRYIADSTGDVGVVFYDADDPEYSAHFSGFHEWILLTDGYMNVDYGIFINARSVHNDDGVALTAMKYILRKYIQE